METSDSDYKKEGYSEQFASNLNKDIRRDMRRKMRGDHPGRVLGGFLIVIIGSLFLAKQLGADFPAWLFTWPMILIAVGLFTGAKHSFRIGGWIVVLGLGIAFLIDENSGLVFHQYFWPIGIIAIGLIMILRPRRKKKDFDWARLNTNIGATSNASASSDDSIDSTSVFGGEKKSVFSKDFKGGDITIFFGGMELNLSQADITSPVTLDITQFFGGTKLVIPSNWKIKSDIVTVFGSYEDKRVLSKDMPETDKVLILDGTCVFGGIEIKSF